MLIGADGIGSTVRKQLHPNEIPPRPSGFSAIRGVAYGVSSYLGGLAGVGYLDDGIEAAATRASTDAVYWYMSLLSDDIPSDASSVERIRLNELPGLTRHSEQLLLLQGPAIRGTTNCSNVIRFQDGALDTLPCLVMLPILLCRIPGTALEDAVALGLALARSKDIGEALRRYERVRIDRTRKFIKLGPRIARVTTTRNGLIQWFRTFAIRVIPTSVISLAASRRRDPHRHLRQ